MRRIAELIQKGALRPVVGLLELRINHEAGCGVYRGGVCDCDPEIVHEGMVLR